MSEIQEVAQGLTISLEHAGKARGLASELQTVQAEAMGYGGVAQSQLEIAVSGLPYYTEQARLASENGCQALDDSEKAIEILTHGKAISKEMDSVDRLVNSVDGKRFYANFYREGALRNIAAPLNSLEAALSSFDLFTSKLNDATQMADAIGVSIGDAKTAATEIMPKNSEVVGIMAYLTYIREAERVHGNQLGLLTASKNHLPGTGQPLIIEMVDGFKRSQDLLEQAKAKNIEGVASLLVRANSEVTVEFVPELQNLIESIKKGVDMIQRSKGETVQFQEATQTALDEGRRILSIL